MKYLCFALVLALTGWGTPLSAMGPEPELVRLDLVLPQVILDMRYATKNNFTGKVIYKDSTCWLRPDTVRALAKVVKDLRMKGYLLVIFDAYRPPWAQEILWEARPDPKFLAAPWEISRHSRGTTVDVGLADLDGNLLDMPSKFDEFDAKADHDFSDVDEFAAKYGTDLRNVFIKNGFSGVEAEWWHYDLKNWADYPVIYRDRVEKQKTKTEKPVEATPVKSEKQKEKSL